MGMGLIINADPGKSRHMENCRAKLRQHHDTADNYETYQLVLENQGDETLELDVNDVTFFGIVGWDPETEMEKDV